ncbi:DUF2267 domain-containing protein [Cyanobacteria bacterium FACHB-DQ100]|uniref:DUF2267 domain-containing protein n=1 Tax=unclassified Leptolyngbya TaxID=2650499 RepID=UPI0016805E7D|nr:DUF2267 domain-containing protein [Leptolyngbya sp. FACHB-17]MBD1823687.1 DUF2267 domain-containing protein [Cyanobacteria bacterium FACHB-DQ100]MBD2079136.1 DUF2267 domain-containing protein [Leptolyngbya sp. FACHB-17]
MNYDQFIKTVKETGHFSDRDSAIKATKATLETMCERLLGDEASNLAAQLPAELAECLRGREGQMGDNFKIEEFYTRISQRAGVDVEAAATSARTVMTVLSQAVSPGEFADVRINFAKDYDELFVEVAQR